MALRDKLIVKSDILNFGQSTIYQQYQLTELREWIHLTKTMPEFDNIKLLPNYQTCLINYAAAASYLNDFNSISKLAAPWEQDNVRRMRQEAEYFSETWFLAMNINYYTQRNSWTARRMLQQLQEKIGPNFNNMHSLAPFPYWRIESR